MKEANGNNRTIQQEYVAFISYSHKDSAWASWLQKQIEHYRLPGKLAKEKGVPRKLGKVFRDREELATGQNLGDHLLGALDNAENLIVICSPAAVGSQWVNQEIEYFKSIGKTDHIFGLLVEGGAEALPTPLLTDAEGKPLEPLAADPRDHADGKRLAKLKLIAGMLGVKLDQLVQRDKARQQRLMTLYASVAAAFVTVGGAAYVSYLNQRHEQAQAVQLVDFVVSKWDELRPWVPLDMLVTLAEEPLAYLERKGTDNLSGQAQATYAMALRQLGLAYQDQGSNADAAKTLNMSYEIFQTLSAEAPEEINYLFETSQGAYWLGEFHRLTNNPSAAAPLLKQYAAITDALYQRFPTNSLYAYERTGGDVALLALETAYPGTLPKTDVWKLANDAVSNADEMLNSFTGPEFYEADQAANAFAADLYASHCNINQSLPRLDRAHNSAKQAFELEPSLYRHQDLADMLGSFAEQIISGGENHKEAAQKLLALLTIREEISQSDPTNDYAKRRLLQTKLDIFRLSFISEIPLPTNVVLNISREVTSTSFLNEAAAVDLELGALQVMAEYEISKSSKTSDFTAARRFKEKAYSLEPTSLERDKFLPVAYWIAKAAKIPTGNELESMRINETENTCIARLGRWSQALATGNIDAANSIARELIELGYRHPRMTFYSKLAGVPYPPPAPIGG